MTRAATLLIFGLSGETAGATSLDMQQHALDLIINASVSITAAFIGAWFGAKFSARRSAKDHSTLLQRLNETSNLLSAIAWVACPVVKRTPTSNRRSGKSPNVIAYTATSIGFWQNVH